ncbi:MAG TPA: alpha/beta fold hydrolase [Actinomycetes bacterium]|nr:alpha/beta fold hydrolase [Actinomycetes bacterium]
MAEYRTGEADPVDRFVRLDDGDMHVVEDGKPDAPVLLLIHGTAASTAWWDPVVSQLADGYRVIRIDLLGHGRSASPAGGYDIAAQARRVGAALDRLAVDRVVAIGHSTGGAVATALAEQRPGTVAALALIDTGPSPDAYLSQGLLPRVLLAQLPGRLLWRLRTQTTIRKAMRTAVTRPIDIPEAIIEDTLGMTYRAVAGTARAALDYLGERGLPTRLAALGLPVLVVFGTDDQRWRSSSTAAYRVVPGARVVLLPGVGHTPMLEDPQTTGRLLLDFAATAEQPN